MTAITALTIAEARDQLAAGKISAVELADAHLVAMEKAAGLNAFITTTPDLARERAKASDARRKKSEVGALEGIPLGIKDLFWHRRRVDHGGIAHS